MITQIYGIDMSKEWFDAVCFSEIDEKAKRYKNEEKGWKKFIEAALSKKCEVRVCIEHTGGYELGLARACYEAGIPVCLVDGGKISSYRKSFGRAKAKTDQGDAALIARFCSERKLPIWIPLPEDYETLRELVRHRESLIKDKTACRSRLSGKQTHAFIREQTQDLVELLNGQIKQIEKQIEQLIRGSAVLKRAREVLVSIPGIARISAAKILAETGPIENYRTARDYALTAGLCPIVFHTGKSTPPGKLPTYGNRALRTSFYFPAVVSLRHKNGVYPHVKRVLDKPGKSKMTAIAAGMRKLVHIVFGMLKTDTLFDPKKSFQMDDKTA